MHAAFFLAKSFCIPGQCTLPMTLVVIPVVSWLAACIFRPSDLLPYNMTGSVEGSSDLTLRYSLVFTGPIILLSGYHC